MPKAKAHVLKIGATADPDVQIGPMVSDFKQGGIDREYGDFGLNACLDRGINLIF